MVIEHFRAKRPGEVYDRFQKSGRLLADGLIYLDSWLTRKGDKCFQLMETEDQTLLNLWMAKWDDLVDFEVIELVRSRTDSLLPNRSLQLTAQNATAFWVPSALRAPAATELRRWVTVAFVWSRQVGSQRKRLNRLRYFAARSSKIIRCSDIAPSLGAWRISAKLAIGVVSSFGPFVPRIKSGLV